jgi:hypothetical protein
MDPCAVAPLIAWSRPKFPLWPAAVQCSFGNAHAKPLILLKWLIFLQLCKPVKPE